MAFATKEEVAARLARSLTTAEENAVDLVIELVQGSIADLVGEGATWADELDPVPAYYRALCIEKAIGAISNPQSLAAESKQLGSYSSSKTYQRAQDAGIFFTEREEAQIRRTYGSGLSGSSRPDSLATELS